MESLVDHDRGLDNKSPVCSPRRTYGECDTSRWEMSEWREARALPMLTNIYNRPDKAPDSSVTKCS